MQEANYSSLGIKVEGLTHFTQSTASPQNPCTSTSTAPKSSKILPETKFYPISPHHQITHLQSSPNSPPPSSGPPTQGTAVTLRVIWRKESRWLYSKLRKRCGFSCTEDTFVHQLSNSMSVSTLVDLYRSLLLQQASLLVIGWACVNLGLIMKIDENQRSHIVLISPVESHVTCIWSQFLMLRMITQPYHNDVVETRQKYSTPECQGWAGALKRRGSLTFRGDPHYIFRHERTHRHRLAGHYGLLGL